MLFLLFTLAFGQTNGERHLRFNKDMNPLEPIIDPVVPIKDTIPFVHEMAEEEVGQPVVPIENNSIPFANELDIEEVEELGQPVAPKEATIPFVDKMAKDFNLEKAGQRSLGKPGSFKEYGSLKEQYGFLESLEEKSGSLEEDDKSNKEHAHDGLDGGFGEMVDLFRTEHDLKKDATLDLQMITATNTITVDGKSYSLDDAEPVIIYSDDASYIVDGKEMPLPSAAESLTFVGNKDGDTIMVTKDPKGSVRTVDIMGQDGSDKYMAAVTPGVLAAITPEELDENILKKFASGAMALDERFEQQQKVARHIDAVFENQPHDLIIDIFR